MSACLVLCGDQADLYPGNGTGSGASSPVIRPVDAPPVNENVKNSAPNTPVQDSTSDYFAKPPRLANPSTRSLPSTPQGSLKNITFSPRIQFHDAWSASDYDRRGEIATCNRLTPMLAQQIKEELNSFKMVCHGYPSHDISLTKYRKWRFTNCPSPTPISSNESASIFSHGVLAKHFQLGNWRFGSSTAFMS